MAHNVSIRKLPKLRKSDNQPTGKYEYQVSCRCRGRRRELGTFSSQTAADAAKNSHHAEMWAKNRAKGNPTPKRVPQQRHYGQRYHSALPEQSRRIANVLFSHANHVNHDHEDDGGFMESES